MAAVLGGGGVKTHLPQPRTENPLGWVWGGLGMVVRSGLSAPTHKMVGVVGLGGGVGMVVRSRLSAPTQTRVGGGRSVRPYGANTNKGLAEWGCDGDNTRKHTHTHTHTRATRNT